MYAQVNKENEYKNRMNTNFLAQKKNKGNGGIDINSMTSRGYNQVVKWPSNLNGKSMEKEKPKLGGGDYQVVQRQVLTNHQYYQLLHQLQVGVLIDSISHQAVLPGADIVRLGMHVYTVDSLLGVQYGDQLLADHLSMIHYQAQIQNQVTPAQWLQIQQILNNLKPVANAVPNWIGGNHDDDDFFGGGQGHDMPAYIGQPIVGNVY